MEIPVIGKEEEYYDEYNNLITVEFPGLPNYVVVRWHYKGGRLQREQEYLNGKKHGLSRLYYQDGQLQCEEEYQNGNCCGSKWFAKHEEPWGLK